MRGIRAAVLSAVVALIALPVDTVVGVELRDRTCFEQHGAAAAKLLSGEHIWIGMYVNGDTNDCTGSACNKYNQISRESNTDDMVTTRSGEKVSQWVTYNNWSGFDIELIEQLAVRGNFTYTIVSMGNHSDIVNGSACEDEDGNDSNTCSKMYTEAAKELLGEPDDSKGTSNITVDILGGGTWKYAEDREKWAVWSTPVLTPETLLLTKPPMYQRKGPSQTMLTDPFATEVWLYLLLATLVATLLFWSTAVIHEKTQNEIAPIEIAYSTCTQPFGFGMVDPTVTMQRGIALGWMIFCVIIMEFWSSGLTAQLVRDGKFTPSVTWEGIKSSSNPHLTLCAERGAANWDYFNHLRLTDSELYQYNLTTTSNTAEKVNGVANGGCAGSEIDVEGYNAHAKKHMNTGICSTVTAKQPIRFIGRGMMARRNASCILTGIDALIHEYTIGNCTKSTENGPIPCDLFKLWTKHFPEPTCSQPSSRAGDNEGVELKFEVFEVPFIFLFLMTVIGAVFTAIGRGRMTLAVPGCGARDPHGNRWSHQVFGRQIAFGCDAILDWALIRVCLKSKEARLKYANNAWDGDANHAAFKRTQYGMIDHGVRQRVKPAAWEKLRLDAHHLVQPAKASGRHVDIDEYDLYDFTGKFSDVAGILPDPDAPGSSQPKRPLYPCDSRETNQIWFGRYFERLQPRLHQDEDTAAPTTSDRVHPLQITTL